MPLLILREKFMSVALFWFLSKVKSIHIRVYCNFKPKGDAKTIPEAKFNKNPRRKYIVT